jgi:hypothetical protein
MALTHEQRRFIRAISTVMDFALLSSRQQGVLFEELGYNDDSVDLDEAMTQEEYEITVERVKIWEGIGSLLDDAMREMDKVRAKKRSKDDRKRRNRETYE